MGLAFLSGFASSFGQGLENFNKQAVETKEREAAFAKAKADRIKAENSNRLEWEKSFRTDMNKHIEDQAKLKRSDSKLSQEERLAESNRIAKAALNRLDSAGKEAGKRGYAQYSTMYEEFASRGIFDELEEREGFLVTKEMAAEMDDGSVQINRAGDVRRPKLTTNSRGEVVEEVNDSGGKVWEITSEKLVDKSKIFPEDTSSASAYKTRTLYNPDGSEVNVYSDTEYDDMTKKGFTAIKPKGSGAAGGTVYASIDGVSGFYSETELILATANGQKVKKKYKDSEERTTETERLAGVRMQTPAFKEKYGHLTDAEQYDAAVRIIKSEPRTYSDNKEHKVAGFSVAIIDGVNAIDHYNDLSKKDKGTLLSGLKETDSGKDFEKNYKGKAEAYLTYKELDDNLQSLKTEDVNKDMIGAIKQQLLEVTPEKWTQMGDKEKLKFKNTIRLQGKLGAILFNILNTENKGAPSDRDFAFLTDLVMGGSFDNLTAVQARFSSFVEDKVRQLQDGYAAHPAWQVLDQKGYKAISEVKAGTKIKAETAEEVAPESLMAAPKGKISKSTILGVEYESKEANGWLWVKNPATNKWIQYERLSK